MTAGVYNLTIERGADISKSFYVKDSSRVAVPLTGYTARMQARESSTSTNPFIDVTTENSGIVIDEPNGKVTLVLTDEFTAAITADYGIYDLELIDSGGLVSKLLAGSVIIIGEPTR